MSLTIDLKKYLTLAFLFLVALFLILAFNGGKMQHQVITSLPSPAIQNIPETAWENLSSKKILFGHKSVGYNIIEGIEDLLKENPQIKLKIIETVKPWEIKTPALIHFQVGKNTQPKTKIDDFSRIVETTEQEEEVNIAFFKFCYVDIQPNTDVIEVFANYKNAMKKLSQAFPNTTFIYVTVPLTSEESSPMSKLTMSELKRGAKYLLNKLSNKPAINLSAINLSANVNRNEFNELLRKEYEGKEAIFDLAQIESTFPDGRRQVSLIDGKQHFSLVPDYTDDGGHLNKLGRQVVAQKLLIFLAQL